MHGAGLEAVADIGSGQRSRLAGPVGRRLRGAVADDAGVHSAPGQFAAEAAVFDLRAAVHDHGQAGGLALCRRLVVADAKLHPHHLGADGDGVVHDGADEVRGAEHVHHVDRFGDVAQAGVDPLAQQVFAGGARIDRDHAVAFALEVLHDEVTRPVPVRRGADHGDGADGREDAAQQGVGIGDRVEDAHEGLTGSSLIAVSGTEYPYRVMAGLVPAIHDFTASNTASRGWPGQARQWHFRAVRAASPYSRVPVAKRYRACWIADNNHRPPRERTNVQISVAVTCSAGLPSTTRPDASRVTSIIEKRIATVA